MAVSPKTKSVLYWKRLRCIFQTDKTTAGFNILKYSFHSISLQESCAARREMGDLSYHKPKQFCVQQVQKSILREFQLCPQVLKKKEGPIKQPQEPV